MQSARELELEYAVKEYQEIIKEYEKIFSQFETAYMKKITESTPQEQKKPKSWIKRFKTTKF